MTGSELAALVLRASVGATMVAHGVRHGRTLDGTSAWFRSIGFCRPRTQAVVSSVVEVGAGSALLAGALTPAASAAVVGTMAVAARTVHVRNGFFITAEGYEYVLAVGAAATALAALGPGRWSVDRLLGRGQPSVATAALAAGLGLAGAAAHLALFWRSQPAERG